MSVREEALGRWSRSPRSARALAAARLPEALATTALAGLLVTGLAIGVRSAAGPSRYFVPASRAGFPDWLAGPFGGLGAALSPEGFSLLFLAMGACYVTALACARAIRRRWALTAIAALHVVFLLSPPLFSPDVFGYLVYARLGGLHGLNPYVHAGVDAHLDPSYPFTGFPLFQSPYGPLFTLASYGLVPLGVAGGLWTLKAVIAAASLGCVGLVWACARRLGRDPVPPAIFVGLNPLLLVHGVGGAHNDVLMVLLLLVGVYFAVAGYERLGGAAVAVATAVKATALVVLPYMVLGSSRSVRALTGALAALALLGLASFAAFGPGLAGYATTLAAQAGFVSRNSLPSQLAQHLGTGELTLQLRLLALVVLAGSLVVLLVRVWRGADWIACAGWAMLVVVATSAYLMHWYIVWVLPLAALGDSRWLRLATLGFGAFVFLGRMPLVLW